MVTKKSKVHLFHSSSLAPACNPSLMGKYFKAVDHTLGVTCRKCLAKATIHWLMRSTDLKTYCGLTVYLNTTHKEKVTCLNCKRLMRQHGHLPEEQP